MVKARNNQHPPTRFMLLEFKNIDAETWTWGDVFHIISCEDTSAVLDKIKPLNCLDKTFLLSLPAAGNIKYRGHHGMIQAAVVLCAAGIVPEDAYILTVIAGHDDTADAVHTFTEAGIKVAYAEGSTDKEQILPAGSIKLDTIVRPPEVTLNAGKFSSRGIERLLGGVAGKTLTGIRHTAPNELRNAFPEYYKFDLFDAITLGHFHGWWEEYADVSPRYGFGTNWLALTDMTKHPFFANKKMLPNQMLAVGEDIGRIWSHFYRLNEKDFQGRLNLKTTEGIRNAAEELGMEPLLDVYFSGVPLADILA